MDAHLIPTMVMRPQTMMSCIPSHGASRSCGKPWPIGGKGEEEEEEESQCVFPHAEMRLVTNGGELRCGACAVEAPLIAPGDWRVSYSSVFG